MNVSVAGFRKYHTTEMHWRLPVSIPGQTPETTICRAENAVEDRLIIQPPSENPAPDNDAAPASHARPLRSGIPGLQPDSPIGFTNAIRSTPTGHIPQTPSLNELPQFGISAIRPKRLICQIGLPHVAKPILAILHAEVSNRRAFPELAFV